MSLRKKSAEGLKWSFLETVGIRLFSVSTYFVLAKILDPTAFGLVALTNTFIFFSEAFVDQGFVAALVQKKDLLPKHLSSAFWGNLVLGGLLFFLTYIGSPWIASLYGEPMLTDILRVHAITFVISAFAKVQLALLQRELKLKTIAIARTIAIVISCTVSIFLAYQGYGAWSLIFQQLIFNFLQTAILWILGRWVPSFVFSWECYRSIFSFGSKVMMNRFVMYVIRYADSLLIGYFLGTELLGYYSFAQKIFITLTDLINLTFTKVTFSVFSLLQDQKQRIASELRKFIDLTATVTFPLFSATFVFAPYAVPLLFGEKWLPSISIIQVFSFAGVLICFYSCFNNLLAGLGKVGLNLRIKIVYLLLSLVLIFFAVQISIEMVAATYIISMTITLIIILFYVSRFINLNIGYYTVNILKPLIFSIALALIVYLSSQLIVRITLPILAVQVVLSGAAYVGYLLVTKPNIKQQLGLAFNRKPVEAK